MIDTYTNQLIAIKGFLDSPLQNDKKEGLALLLDLIKDFASAPNFREVLLEFIEKYPGQKPTVLGYLDELTQKPPEVTETFKPNPPEQVNLKPVDQFRFDVFISYSHKNEKWVQNKLLPFLDARGLSICIDFRDFEPGAPSLTEMERAVTKSQKTLVVLTPDYLQSEWAEFENILTQTLDPAARQRRLIPILLEPCELPPRLRMLTYLDFTKASQIEFQFDRLVNAIKLIGQPSATKLPKENMIEDKKKQRDLYLQKLYELSNNDMYSSYRFTEVGHALGWNDETSDVVTDYLQKKGLIEFPTYSTVCITIAGIEYIENALSKSLTTKNNKHTRNSSNQVSILFLGADPSSEARLRIGEEMREIQEKLQIAKLRTRFKLHIRTSVRSPDVSQALLDIQPKIVHFSGHGTHTGALCFENAIGEMQPVEASALAALFEQFAESVDCVLLNACYSEIQAQAIAQHIEWVIGMSNAIGDQAAVAFSIGFYQALGAGKTIEEAYKLGCVQIMLQGIPEHLTPVLIKKQ